ncbi:hypothetical protein BRADI_5g21323v3 [Brachypodium distachyon]|uniref:Uncharacterized protein n=1 Tax=Brachypodium distachyon TaxID=15368 RepID=A0A0Q3EDI5_BRADI|nr:hypothetical protein BRADI_5g21323v3 [Brachypodium distachyon]
MSENRTVATCYSIASAYILLETTKIKPCMHILFYRNSRYLERRYKRVLQVAATITAIKYACEQVEQ